MEKITNPDDQVIAMVNTATDNRRRVAANRRILAQMNKDQREKAAAEKRQECRQMPLEAGSCGGLGGLILAAMAQDMISTGLALPLALACFVWAGIRADRYFRR